MTKPTHAELTARISALVSRFDRMEAQYYEEKKRADDLERTLSNTYKHLDTLRGRLLEQQAAMVEYALALATNAPPERLEKLQQRVAYQTVIPHS